MAITLFRVDERLVHGQVVIGWGGELRPERYVVVDDPLAASAWEQDLYRLAVPDEVELRFASIADARARLAAWRSDDVVGVLLTRDLATMAALAGAGGMKGAEVNLGGIHHRPGRQEVRPYLFLDDDDRSAVRALMESGVDVSARDLPSSPRVGPEHLLP